MEQYSSLTLASEAETPQWRLALSQGLCICGNTVSKLDLGVLYKQPEQQKQSSQLTLTFCELCELLFYTCLIAKETRSQISYFSLRV